MNQNNYCVIMAGGIGSRFWPVSKTAVPKQFIDILGTGRTLIQQTFDRFNSIIPAENVFIVTNEIYRDIINKQLPQLSANNILCEPLRRNTAPCIAYACYKIQSINPNANIVVAPSDHLITKEEEFIRIVKESFDLCSTDDVLVTIGIKPCRPETGYGYIQIVDDKQTNKKLFYKVKTFTEKPNLDLAKVFLDSGDFFWNSGIFIWSVSSIIKALKQNLPDVANLFELGINKYNTIDEAEFINATYPVCKSISIDYGVMEKASNVYVYCADFGWSDLGTWGSLYEHFNKDANENAIKGDNIFLYDTSKCIVNVPNNKVVVVQGLSNYIIAESDNTLLICNLNEEQLIKQFVHDVQLKKGDEFI